MARLHAFDDKIDKLRTENKFFAYIEAEVLKSID